MSENIENILVRQTWLFTLIIFLKLGFSIYAFSIDSGSYYTGGRPGSAGGVKESGGEWGSDSQPK